ncbi:hypothetical protein CR194_18885 [Salipaludibacillus keqinensis]|uniref:Uncharacterized protein n=1 Tax=Salipaludibacillus keqinensis TaxID=2045207 RepID=A0A323TGL0_9BACI|nr:YndJ family transporter [Salipaludibacillus keqinensis]PYZ91693.1 hypothetical protein CR194_18885 [Salipaludibacillus keqinensis]
MTFKHNMILGIVASVIGAVAASPSIVELALMFVFFIFVPSFLYLASAGRPQCDYQRRMFQLSCYSFPFAVFGILAIFVDNGWLSALLAAVWFIFTLSAGITSLQRLYKRKFSHPEEAIIDIGIAFLIIGGIWHVLARWGIAQFLPYTELTIDLTSIHYHYSAFILPVFTGLFGRWIFERRLKERGSRGNSVPFIFLCGGMAIGSPLVALGIAVGNSLQLVMVSIYVIFIYWLCSWCLIKSVHFGLLAGWMIGLACGSLLVAMGISLLYRLGMYINLDMPQLTEMIHWHGGLNAFVFSVLATGGWLLLSPEAKVSRTK